MINITRVFEAMGRDLAMYGTTSVTIIDDEFEFAILRHPNFTVDDLFYA